MLARISSTLATALLAGAAWAGDFDTTFPEDPHKEAVIRHLRPALEPIDGAARVYAVIDCQGPAWRFPRVTLQSALAGKTGVDAVREIFAKDTHTSITVSSNGIARINIGRAPSTLLQTKIRRLRFTERERYNIISAQLALENAEEVQAAIRRLHLKQPLTVISENVGSSTAGLPRLPSSIKDVTFDQALDLLAATFASVIFYEECTDGKDGHFFTVDQGCIVCGPWRHTQAGAKRADMPTAK